MCKFHSAIVLRNGDILQNENLTSHEDQILFFKIKDTQINQGRFVRIEYKPEDSADYADIDKYKLFVDEYSTPEWFIKHREYVTERMRDFVKKKIILTDQDILTGGIYIVGKNVTIGKVVAAEIYHNYGTVTKNSGTVTDNYGTVTDNSGTVTYNYGTVTDNSGTVTYNYRTVTDNSGTVTKNSGTVTDNSGTVTDNYGTVIDKK